MGKLLKLLCLLLAVIGWLIVLATLFGPLGVWVNLWDFRTGATPISLTHNWLHWYLIGLALVTALTFFIYQGPRKTTLSLAITALIGGFIAWYIPETFVAPEGQSFPPIHDITTDPANPVQYEAILPLRQDAPNSVEYGSGRDMTPEKLASLQTEAYPFIQPQYYDANPDQVFDWALAAVDAMGWELVEANKSRGRIEATATTFWFRFKDDVVVEITEQDGQTVLNARSLSRVGGGDAGTNARRLRNYFAEIDKERG